MNISISLTPELVGFIKTKVDSGRYTSVSEVVRDALRVLERVEATRSADLGSLRDAWNEGLLSGDAGELDFAELKSLARERLSASTKT